VHGGGGESLALFMFFLLSVTLDVVVFACGVDSYTISIFVIEVQGSAYGAVGGCAGAEDGEVILPIVLPDIVVLTNKEVPAFVEIACGILYIVGLIQPYKVADIVERHINRINDLISVDGEHKQAFDNFLDGLRKNLNPEVSADDAVQMLAQQLVTRPVFEGLFENYSFVNNNPVSIAMQNILDKLEGDGMTKDREVFAGIYKQVKDSCKGMGDAASRQRIINKIYLLYLVLFIRFCSHCLNTESLYGRLDFLRSGRGTAYVVVVMDDVVASLRKIQ